MTVILSILMTIAVCFFFLMIFGRQLIRRIRLSKKIPGPSLWELLTVYGKELLGHHFNDCITKLTEKYNYKPWGFWAGTDYLVVISDPDIIGEAFKHKNLANKPEILYSGLRDELGENMLLLNGPKWKRHRSAFNPTFKKTSLVQNINIIYEETETALATLKQHSDGTEFDIALVMKTLLFLVVSRSLGARDFNASDEELNEVAFYIDFILQKASDTASKPGFYYLQYLTSKKKEFKRYQKARAIVFKLFDTFASNTMKQYEAGNITQVKTPFVFALEDHIQKRILTDDEYVSNLIILVGAGVETTSTSLAASVYLLAIHPEVQERAAEEVRSVFGDSSRPVTAEDLVKLEYLERVIKESLRLFPPGPFFFKIAEEDTDLKGTLVPKGALVMFNAASLHRNPRVYKDPLKFDPDRFSPDYLEDQQRRSFIPFSAGSRDCIGKIHAMMTMKTVLCSMLRKYKILPGHGLDSVEDIKTKWYFTVHMHDNYVRLVPLNSSIP